MSANQVTSSAGPGSSINTPVDAEKTVVVCPYDASHKLLIKDLHLHLLTERMKHRNGDWSVCPFNTQHIVPKAELSLHIRLLCPERTLVEQIDAEVRSNVREEERRNLYMEDMPIEADH